MPATRKTGRDTGGSDDSEGSLRGVAPASNTATGPAPKRALEAIIVAVKKTSESRQWYTMTKELQLASLQICEACRSAHAVHLRVDGDIPATLLASKNASRQDPDKGVSSRVPRLRARRVTWKLPSLDFLSDQLDIFAEVEELVFGDDFNGGLEVRAWPSRLRKIEFGEQSIFNQPIVGVAWPPSLQQLMFGCAFDQAIHRLAWPMSVWELSFGGEFDQPLGRVAWPTSIRQLSLGGYFTHPVKAIKWPPSLEELRLGANFNQPIERIKSPSLRRLALSGTFCKSLKNLSKVMPALERLTLQLNCNSSLSSILLTIQWPARLSHLTVGMNARLEGVSIPASVLVSYSSDEFWW